MKSKIYISLMMIPIGIFLLFLSMAIIIKPYDLHELVNKDNDVVVQNEVSDKEIIKEASTPFMERTLYIENDETVVYSDMDEYYYVDEANIYTVNFYPISETEQTVYIILAIDPRLSSDDILVEYLYRGTDEYEQLLFENGIILGEDSFIFDDIAEITMRITVRKSGKYVIEIALFESESDKNILRQNLNLYVSERYVY